MGFEVDGSNIARTREEFAALGRDTLVEMCQLQIVQIRERCARGIGVNDDLMPPKADGSTRDLLDTGQMLRSIHTENVTQTPEGWEGTIAFSGRQNALKAAHNQGIDPWFGVSPEDERGLQALTQAALDDLRRGRD